MKVEDRDKTTFTAPLGNIRFKRMSFELHNAPSLFQGPKNTLVIVYLNDVMILSFDIDEHLDDLSQLIELLRLVKLHY